MNKLFFDIETLPANESSYQALQYLYQKKKTKKKSSKAKDEEEESEESAEEFTETSFDGAFGQVLCIGYSINDGETKCICNDGNEKQTLKEFWEIAKNTDLFIGHNVMDFDLRFIYQRSIILGIKPTKELSFARYRNFPIYDTMKEWSRWGFDKTPKNLEHLALAMGIPSPKAGIDGSQVFQFYKDGKIKDICEYCKKDVETTRSIYKKMTFDGLVEEEKTPF